MIVSADADGPGGLSAQFAQRSNLGIDTLEVRRKAPQKPFSRFRRCHASGRPGQKPHAQTLLQQSNRMTQGGLRDPELSRGFSEASFTRHGEESDKVRDLIARHS